MRLVPVLLVCACLAPSAWLAWKARDAPHLGYFHDDGLYWVSAKSLASGAGYRIESLPGAPAQTKYPPLYPLALAAVWKAAPDFPANLPIAVALSWLALAAFVAIARAAFPDLGIRGAAAWALTAALALSPYYALCGFSLLSELPFACLFLGALWLIPRARTRRMAAAAGLVAAAALLTRSAGVVLLVAGFAFLWRRSMAFCAAALPALAAWTLWSHAHRTASSDTMTLFYTDYLGYWLREVSITGLPLVLWKNADGLLSAIGGMVVFGLPDSIAGKTVARVIAVAALAGAARLWRRRIARPYCIAATAYLALLLVWNFPPDQRFLTPVFPVLLTGLYLEARRLASLLRSARRGVERAAAAVFAALLAAGGLAAAAGAAAGLFLALPRFLDEQRTRREAFAPVYRWIAANTSRDSAVLAYFDAELYLYSGRKACYLVIPTSLAYAGDRSVADRYYESVASYARQHNLEYAVLSPFDLEAELPPGERLRANEIIRKAVGDGKVHESGIITVYQPNPVL